MRFSVFSFASRIFVIAHWSILMMAALKSFSHNSNIWFILVLASVDCLFAFKLWFYWLLVWQGIFVCLLNILDIMLETLDRSCLPKRAQIHGTGTLSHVFKGSFSSPSQEKLSSCTQEVLEMRATFKRWNVNCQMSGT